MARSTKQQRDDVRLMVADDWSPARMAIQLGLTERTVRKRFAREIAEGPDKARAEALRSIVSRNADPAPGRIKQKPTSLSRAWTSALRAIIPPAGAMRLFADAARYRWQVSSKRLRDGSEQHTVVDGAERLVCTMAPHSAAQCRANIFAASYALRDLCAVALLAGWVPPDLQDTWRSALHVAQVDIDGERLAILARLFADRMPVSSSKGQASANAGASAQRFRSPSSGRARPVGRAGAGRTSR